MYNIEEVITSPPVVRFAPSPTGPMHIGGIRTAWFNYLFAKKHGGKFVLRIEDTDTARCSKDSLQHILDTLSWCGMKADETYIQSSRIHIYRQYVDKLIMDGNAYYAFDTVDQLSLLPDTFVYGSDNRYNANKVVNEFTVSPQVKEEMIRNKNFTIRLKVPAKTTVVVNDLIRNKRKFDSKTLTDTVLLKSDGTPTYHLASVVDDHLMGVTHVVRGEEWLSSAPIHQLLYDFLGWESPQWVHLPLVLDAEGSKISKRKLVAEHNFPMVAIPYPDTTIDILSCQKMGIVPEAFLFYISGLGWTGNETPSMNLVDDLKANFCFDDLHTSPARIDIQKLKSISKDYICNRYSAEVLLDLLKITPEEIDYEIDLIGITSLVEIFRKRAQTLHDLRTGLIVTLSDWSHDQLKAIISNETSFGKSFEGTKSQYMDVLKEVLVLLPEWKSPQMVDKGLEDVVFKYNEDLQRQYEENGGNPFSVVVSTVVLRLIRIAIMGSIYGPAIGELVYACGMDLAMKKIKCLTESI